MNNNKAWRFAAAQRRAIQKTPHPGTCVISSPVAPHTAILVRFDFYGDESGNEAVPRKRGSCKRSKERGGVEMQIGDRNAVWSGPQVDITS